MISKMKKNELYGMLNYLRLSGIKEILEESIKSAEQESMSYSDYLLYLLGHESDIRRNKKVARLLKESRLPSQKTLETFDMKRIPLLTCIDSKKASGLLVADFMLISTLALKNALPSIP